MFATSGDSATVVCCPEHSVEFRVSDDAMMVSTQPAQYPRTLKNAVVVIHFSMKHGEIDSLDTDVAEITDISRHPDIRAHCSIELMRPSG